MKRKTLLLSLLGGASLNMLAFCVSFAQAPQVAAGEQVYSDYCSNCHGEGLRNTSAGHDRFVSAVLDGKRQMPPWRGALDMEQIESIWAYIRATVDR